MGGGGGEAGGGEASVLRVSGKGRVVESLECVGVDFRQLAFALLTVFVLVIGLSADPLPLPSSSVPEQCISFPALSPLLQVGFDWGSLLERVVVLDRYT